MLLNIFDISVQAEVNIGPNFLTLTRLVLIYISGEPTGPDTKTAFGNPIRPNKIVAQATKYKFIYLFFMRPRYSIPEG